MIVRERAYCDCVHRNGDQLFLKINDPLQLKLAKAQDDDFSHIDWFGKPFFHVVGKTCFVVRTWHAVYTRGRLYPGGGVALMRLSVSVFVHD